MLTTALLIMQFIISAKAGLVNTVEGETNVQVQEQAPAGKVIQTGSSGRVEILLNPGSFLRLGENTQVILDSVELANIAVRVLSGAVIIESSAIEKDTPIRVTNGRMSVLIVAPGRYRFSESAASVLDGELQMADSTLSIKKGWEIVANGDHLEQIKNSPQELTSLDQWSQQRSEQIASTNSALLEENADPTIAPSVYSGSLLYPGSALPYGFPTSAVPALGQFNFFDWYSGGGYGLFRPQIPLLFPNLIYRPFLQPIPRPPNILPHPPASKPIGPIAHPAPIAHPTPVPAPSHPVTGIRAGRPVHAGHR